MSLTNEKSELHFVDEKPESVDAATPHQVVKIDNIKVLGLGPEDADFYLNFSAEKRKKVIHKVDVRLIPMLAVLYLISHMTEQISEMPKSKGSSKTWVSMVSSINIVLSVFFVPYVLLEVPSSMLLKKFKRPSIYVGVLTICWGIIMTMMGVVKNFAGLLMTRILLGIFEAGFCPGAIYLCSYWYMPKDLATRIFYCYCASALSGAFSGLLAAAIANMNGVGGYEGWRWIFLLEGIATVFLGVACLFLLIDSPSLSTRWLEPNVVRFLELQRFIKDGGKFQDERSHFRWTDMKLVSCNWRLYLQAYILLVCSACSYGTKFTLPTITKSMGFSDTNAQLMSVPPYVAGAISSTFFARLSDHFYWRLPFVAIPLSFVFNGYSIVIPYMPAASSWAANNLTPSSRRAIGVAFNICVGNIGEVISSYMYLDSEKPKYFTGFGLSLAFGATGFLVAFFLEWTYKSGNKRKEQIAEDDIRAKYTDGQLLNMGDKSPLFKYVL